MHMRQAYIFCWQYLFHIFIFNFISFFVVEPPITAPESRIDSFSAHISFVSICGWMVVHCCLCLKYVYRCLRKNVLFFDSVPVAETPDNIFLSRNFVCLVQTWTNDKTKSFASSSSSMNEWLSLVSCYLCLLFVCLFVDLVYNI